MNPPNTLALAYNPEYQTIEVDEAAAKVLFEDSGIPGVIKELVTLCKLTILFCNLLGLQSLGDQTAAMISGLCFHPCQFIQRWQDRASLFAPFDALNLTWKGAAHAQREQAAVPPYSPKTLQANKEEQARMLVSIKQAQQAPV